VQGVGPKLLEKLRPHVFVEAPERDEEDQPAAQAVRPIAAKVEKADKPLVVRKREPLTEPIDVNHATAADLRRLPGIGPALSQRIIEKRQQQPFRSVEDLRRVRGIGAKTLERLRPHVVAGSRK
jgi:competence protein ComEA